MLRACARLFPVLAFSLSLAAMPAPDPERLRERVMQVEVTMFNTVIDSYDGGILYDLFGGAEKAKRGFLENQRAISREDVAYFPPDLVGKEGDDSRALLREINHNAIVERRELVAYIRDWCRREKVADLDATGYKRLFGAFLLEKFKVPERALSVYMQEVAKIVRFNEGLSLGLFGALIKSRMNDVTNFTVGKRVLYMREAMAMAAASRGKPAR